jgi:hypothetical protein
MLSSRILTVLLTELLILSNPFALAPTFACDAAVPASPTLPDDEDDAAAQHAPAKDALPTVRRHVEPRHAPASPSIPSLPSRHAAPAVSVPASAAPFRATVNPPLHC